MKTPAAVTTPLLSIIIVNWNGIRFLPDCLSSIQRHTEDGTEVILVDNHSSDGSDTLIEKSYPWVRLVRAGKNLGFSKGNNLGASMARGEFLLLLNNDTVLLSDVAPALNLMAADSDVGALGAKMVSPKGIYRHSAGRFPVPQRIVKISSMLRKDGPFKKGDFPQRVPEPGYRVDFVEASFLLVRKSLWQQLGGLDESFFMYGEDMEFCYRIKQAGFRTVFLPSVAYIHYGGFTLDRELLVVNGIVGFHEKWSGRPMIAFVLVILCLRLAARYLLYRLLSPGREHSVSREKADASMQALRGLLQGLHRGSETKKAFHDSAPSATGTSPLSWSGDAGRSVRTILIVHQSADLYGSDKHVLHLVDHLPADRFYCIVLLAESGPLQEALESRGVETHQVPLPKLARAALSIKALLELPARCAASIRAMDNAIGNRTIDVVHSNTMAVLSGALWAKLHRVPHLWNVHEMIVHPRYVRRLFPLLLALFADRVVCNSKATCNLLTAQWPGLKRKSNVVWNGIQRPATVDRTAADRFRDGLRIPSDHVLVALVGRINRWKGQQLLVRAADILTRLRITDAHFIMVGSPPAGQRHFSERLGRTVQASHSKDRIRICDFEPDIWKVWDACDIAVVPSTEPEPFGFVAVEAMAAGKPVVAADHGGLAEIVVPDQTGILVEPNSPTALARALERLIMNKPLRERLGQAGRVRASGHFAMKPYVQAYAAHYLEMAPARSSLYSCMRLCV